jgi:hypothetical protein
METLKRLWSRLRAYLSPTPDWSRTIRRFHAGEAVWPVPGHPEIQPFIPWPPDWCSWEPDAEADSKVRFVSHVSLVSGRVCEGDNAVKCARCAIPIHMDEADMLTNLDVPACPWCVGAVRRMR